MKKLLSGFLFITMFIILVVVQMSCSKNQQDNTQMSQSEMVARGKYLVGFGGCNDCHSPKIMTNMGPVPDTTKLLSGTPAGMKLPPIDTTITSKTWVYTSMDLTMWAGPWGVSFPINLTPDGPTGIGNWTPDIFIKAMRTGKHMGYGRPILPPMPWFSVAVLNDNDLKALFAYLRSIPPIKNQVPDPVPPNMVAQASNFKK